MKKLLFVLVYCLSISAFSQSVEEKKTIGEQKALFIYNFSKYIEWPNFKQLKTFKIGVMGDDYNYIFNGLQQLASQRDVKGTPLEIIRVNYDTPLHELQVLYFDNPEKHNIKEIYKKVQKKPVLLIGENYPYGQCMINFIRVNDKIEFELNEEKCNDVGLEVNIAIKTLAIKTKRDWESLQEKMETLSLSQNEQVVVQTKDLEALLAQQKQLQNEIEKNKKALEAQVEELKIKTALVEQSKKELSESNRKLEEQKAKVAQQQQQINQQEENLKQLNFTITAKQIKLVEQQELLEKDQKKLAAVKAKFDEVENELTEKEKLVAENEAYIQNQYKIIDAKTSTIEEQKYIIWLSVAFLIIVSAFGVWVYRSYQIKKKDNQIITNQKHEIEAQHKEIRDSINYAKRIQQAIIPPVKLFKENLKNSFVIYHPKDVVSGDFYWMESLSLTSPKGEGAILFAAADCTGHGVPGAIVSVVCNNALKRSVNEFKLLEPGKILDKTREIVVQEFEKGEEEVKDGMDIALCSLRFDVSDSRLHSPQISNMEHETTAVLQYAGANNPLWIVNPNRKEWPDFMLPFGEHNEGAEIKADKQPIGKIDQVSSFTTHTIELVKGDTIYVFTDGYADQFGGEKGKKLMYKPFKRLLTDIYHLPMEEQQQALEKYFSTWKGRHEQVDDVCVIGVRV